MFKKKKKINYPGPDGLLISIFFSPTWEGDRAHCPGVSAIPELCGIPRQIMQTGSTHYPPSDETVTIPKVNPPSEPSQGHNFGGTHRDNASMWCPIHMPVKTRKCMQRFRSMHHHTYIHSKPCHLHIFLQYTARFPRGGWEARDKTPTEDDTAKTMGYHRPQRILGHSDYSFKKPYTPITSILHRHHTSFLGEMTPRKTCKL